MTHVDRPSVSRSLETGEFLWIDLTAPDEAAFDALGDCLPLHPLALADTREFGQRPKVDRYDGGSLIVAYTARAQDELSVPVEVHLHVAAGYLVTVHRDALPVLHALHRFVPSTPPRPDDSIVFRVLDALVRECQAVIEVEANALDALEEAVLRQTQRPQLERLVRIRHSITRLHRRIAAQDDVFADIEHALLELPDIDRAVRPYLRNVGDRLARAEGRLAALQTTAGSLADTYFNANANRLTEVSERLSVIATILLPLTLVTGFFGQNFGWLVAHIDSLASFLIFGVGGLALPAAVAVIYLGRRSDKKR